MNKEFFSATDFLIDSMAQQYIERVDAARIASAKVTQLQDALEDLQEQLDQQGKALEVYRTFFAEEMPVSTSDFRFNDTQLLLHRLRRGCEVLASVEEILK